MESGTVPAQLIQATVYVYYKKIALPAESGVTAVLHAGQNQVIAQTPAPVEVAALGRLPFSVRIE